MSSDNYIKPYSDIFVKYLFGSKGSESILLNFINDVLGDADFPKIVSVKILNPFNLQTFINDKQSVIDVKAEDEHKRTYNIEIQSAYQKDFLHRVLYTHMILILK